MGLGFIYNAFISYFYLKIITRWLRAILKMTEGWEVSDCLNYFRLVSSKKISPPGRCLALANDPTKMSPEDPLTLSQFGTLVSQYGGLRSYNTMLKQPTSDLDYVSRRENGLIRKCCLVPFNLIKSDVWIAFCLRTGCEDWVQYADIDTPSG